ncbi:DUF1993 domain-containing protein [Tahibacter amnicola]|uniref:DUF1993 domain-containing protein n=1 Tax=Tahibacter amnicola TaxID=2976241 RepID=A0ABY6BMI7_9GAMM|nr:DUF1993 domain-containing protein [Tahibacter amnicola]UXI69776.1 DUF1993 domain-containing protein [Tahibacter amnicola]
MTLPVHDVAVGTFALMLRNLSKFLDKAEAHATNKGFDVAVLVGARLAPDMLPLSRQIQIASDMAKGAAARLSGTEIPVFEDTESTLAELRERIEKTIRFVEGIDPAKFVGGEFRDITIQVRDRTFEFKGQVYLATWALPNFYFHVTTAYNILRHNGVDLGKRDFLGLV